METDVKAQKRERCPSPVIVNGNKKPKIVEGLELRKEHTSVLAEPDHDNVRIITARQQYMYSESGDRYLDMRNNVHHVGHCHPRVTESCINQMSLLNTNSRFLHDNMLLLAKRLSEKCCGLTSFVFVNSGSEANDLALQIAERVTGGNQIISIEGAYHGHLKSLHAVGSHPLAKGERPDYAHLASLPCMYRGKYTDPETAGQQYADEIKSIVENCKSKQQKIAAFICEPLPCCAGQIVLPKGYLKASFQYVRAAGGLCIADEIQCGYGRTGTNFWAFEMQDVVPDIITIGKPMGNGHPVAAVITTKEIADKFSATGVEYFNTFGGNPVSMAVASSVLDVFEDEKLQENARIVGTYLKDKLQALQPSHELMGDVRGMGLLVGVEFVKDKQSKEPATTEAKTVSQRLCREHKILCLTDGKYNNVLKLKPPMCITKEDMDYFVTSFDEVLKTISID